MDHLIKYPMVSKGKEGKGGKRRGRIRSKAVKAGSEGEPKKAPGHGSHGRTNGRTDYMIIKEKLCYF